MKYVIAFYQNALSDTKGTVPFGIVVTDGESIAYDFDTSKHREQLIQAVSKTFDPFIFEHFKDTFYANFVEKGVALTTDSDGHQRAINVNSEEFLDYLRGNSQGVYQYSAPKTADAEDPQKLVNDLMQQFIQPS